MTSFFAVSSTKKTAVICSSACSTPSWLIRWASASSPQLELHTVEITKFPDLREGPPNEKWLYWLKYGHEMTEQEVAQLGVPELIEAEGKLAMISQDRQVRVDYERRRMAYHDAISPSWFRNLAQTAWRYGGDSRTVCMFRLLAPSARQREESYDCSGTRTRR